MPVQSGNETKKLLMVVPCFNEENRLKMDYWISVIRSTPEVIWKFVNDGSSDKTQYLIENLTFYGALTTTLGKNSGKAEAVRRGIKESLLEHYSIYGIGFVDSDMAFSKEELIDFCNESIFEFTKKEPRDCFLASRVKLAGTEIYRSNFRHLLARVVATWFGMFWKDIPYDTQCGLKSFRNSTAFKKSVETPFETRWLFDIELILRVYRNATRTIKIYERPLNYWKDISGSKINIKEQFRIFKEIMIVTKLLINFRYKLTTPK